MTAQKTNYRLTDFDDADWSEVAQVFLDCLLDHIGQPKKESVIESHSYGDSSEYAKDNWDDSWSEEDLLEDLLDSPTGNTEATHVSGHGLSQTSVSQEIYDDVHNAYWRVILRDNSHLTDEEINNLRDNEDMELCWLEGAASWIHNFELEDTLGDALRAVKSWLAEEKKKDLA